MDETLWGLMNILGPLILLVLLAWVVIRSRRRAGRSADSPPAANATDSTMRTERATHELYDEEERRRRDGTDDL